MEPRNKRNTSLSMSDLGRNTPIVDNIISMLPSGHDKALKYAFYNVIALVLAGVSILALIAVYCILEPFIKSLLWALLCGSVLYPFKRKLVDAAQSWIQDVKESPVPFSVHVLSSPLIIADAVSDKIGDYVWTYWKYIVAGLGTFIFTYMAYYNPPVTLGLILKWIATTFLSVLSGVLNCVRGEVIVAILVIYSAAVLRTVIAGKSGPPKQPVESQSEDSIKSTPSHDVPDNSGPQMSQITDFEKIILRTLSVLTWTLSLVYICRSLPYTILVPFLICMVAGTAAYFRQRTRDNYAIPHISMLATKLVLQIGSGSRLSRSQSVQNFDLGKSPLGLLYTSFSRPNFRESFSSPRKSAPEQSIKSSQDKMDGIGDEPSASEPSAVFSDDEVDYGFIDSNTFLYAVFLACVIIQVWHHLWLAHLLPIPVLYYGLKKLCYRLGIFKLLKESVIEPLSDFYSDNNNTLSGNIFPLPVRVLLRIMSMADHKLYEFCEAYLDPVGSAVVLVVVLLLVILLLIFAATQVYLEGDHLVRVSIDLINTTVSQHPEFSKLLPEGWESMMGSMVDNAYIQGKEYITNTIRDAIEEKDPEKAYEIEKQVIELWDKVYLSWNKTWDGAFEDSSNKIINQNDAGSGSGIEWNELLETGKTVPQLLEYSLLVNYAKANLGTLMSVMESLWNILVGNVSVAISAITSILSVVFGGGSAIVNLMINLVVFFTALFYLLNSSTTVYKPVEIFRSSIPGDGKHSSRFLCAVEDAVNGVFTASLKMAMFYGMWSWLIHSLFQINIVFVPSFLAAMFGAVPLLMPYWAALPAVLELSLIQGEWTLAILMMLAQMAPMSMVDTQIYSEIKGGGHPYLTGLAVAGGIFYFGIQGAIMGPVILCCVVVAVKMGSSFLRDEDTPDAPHSLAGLVS